MPQHSIRSDRQGRVSWGRAHPTRFGIEMAPETQATLKERADTLPIQRDPYRGREGERNLRIAPAYLECGFP
jgi:hypothetical protein